MHHVHSSCYATSCTHVLWVDVVQRTAHAQPASIQHVCIHHGGVHIFVPEEFLHRPDVIALLQQMRGKTVSEGLATDVFVEPHRTSCLTHSLLQSTLTRVMAADHPRMRVLRQTIGRKDVRPDPESAGTRILTFQRERSINRANPLSDILRMYALDVREMFLEGADEAFRAHRHPVLHTLAIAHDELPLGNVQVFDAQSQTCHPSQPATIPPYRHESWRSGETLDNLKGLLLGQDRGHACGLFGPDGIDGEVERRFEYVAIQQEPGAECLILGRRRPLLIDSQVRQKRLDGCRIPARSDVVCCGRKYNV
jgi:hypothetical protein